jgi:hypothetical protein
LHFEQVFISVNIFTDSSRFVLLALVFVGLLGLGIRGGCLARDGLILGCASPFFARGL